MTNSTSSAQIREARPRLRFPALVFVACTLVAAQSPAPPEPLRFEGTIHRSDDLSAIASIGKFLVIGSDEGARVQVLEPADDARGFRVRSEAIRLLPEDHEVDVEAMAHHEGTLYVLGSHSLKRRLLEPDKEYQENRARLATVSPEPYRQKLFRLKVDPKTGRPSSTVEAVSLRPILERDSILGPFTSIPAAENGVNIEGLAVDGSTLYLGFRSPVLREGFVPVMALRFEEPDDYELTFVQLHGQGIRSLARVSDGFLLLARPEHDVDASSVLYFWNGLDQIPGAGRSRGRLERLLELPAPKGGTPEGLAVLSETESHYDVIAIHDGLPGGHPIRLRVPVPVRHSNR